MFLFLPSGLNCRVQCSGSTLLPAALVFVHFVDVGAKQALRTVVVIAPDSGYAAKPLRGFRGRALSFRKVCRTTSWPQLEVMVVWGGRWSPLCFQVGPDCAAVQTQAAWCYCRSIQHSRLKQGKMLLDERHKSPDGRLIFRKICF